MKRLLSLILLVFIFVALTFTSSALAGDAAAGKAVFSANCNACHLGGKNVVNAAKTLQKDDLDKYGINTLEKVVYQVTNGKAAMPAFKGRLTDKQIEDVATYVLAQAEKGW